MTSSADIPATVWEAHHHRLRRLACHKQYTQELVQWLINQGVRFPAIERLHHCHTQLYFVYDPTQARLRLSHTYACHLPLLCPLCAIRRAAHAGESYQHRTQTLFAQHPEAILSYAVFTIQNQANLAERFAHLQHHARILLARRRAAASARRGHRQFQYATPSSFAPVLAGAYSFEVKRGANSGLWHPHLNLLLLSSQVIEPQQLSAEWLALTHDSSVVYCQPRPADPSTFVEIFKYALKFSDLSYADTWHVYQTLRGRKLLGSVGAFRGLPLASPEAPVVRASAELLYHYGNGAYRLIASSL